MPGSRHVIVTYLSLSSDSPRLLYNLVQVCKINLFNDLIVHSFVN